MSSEGVDDTRRYILQTVGGALTAGLAGCSGGGNSDSNGNNTPTETSTQVQTTSEPDYALPESEHANPAQMIRRWTNVPGDELDVSAYSPSKLSDNYDTTLMKARSSEQIYDMFDFDSGDIPEAFVQDKEVPWRSALKVDQLPNNVTESKVIDQLREAGFTKDREQGDFEVYSRNNTSTTFRAVGDDRHVVVWGPTAEDDDRNNYLNRALQQRNEDTYELREVEQGLLEVLDLQDSVTIWQPEATPLAGNMEGSLRIGADTVDFESGSRRQAFAFENEGRAETAYHVLKDESGDFSSIDHRGQFLITEANYNIDELGREGNHISIPYL